MSFCSSCGSAVSANAKFCSSCGKPTIARDHSGSQVSNRNATAVVGSSGVSTPGNIASAIAQTIFIAPISFLNHLDKILSSKGVTPLAILSGSEPHEIRAKIKNKLSQAGSASLKYICLIGDWDDVPPFRVETPEEVDDGDEFCITDALYGCTEDYDELDIFSAIPSYPVGRIPSLDPAVISRVLFDEANSLDANKAFLFAISAQCWNTATETIVNQFLNDSDDSRVRLDPESHDIPRKAVLSCPDWLEEDLRAATQQKITDKNSVILFNVHGGLDEPVWVGQDGGNYPKIFDPHTIADFNSSLIVCEACYGGALGYSSKSIVESFFEKGGHTFVGSSTIAYGSPNENIAAADFIALHFLQSVAGGATMGEALNFAKKEVAGIDPLYGFIGKKTVLSFNLFGAPWHRRPRASTISAYTNTSSSPGSILDQIRSRSAGLNIDRNNTIENIRNRYRSNLSDKHKQFFLEKDEARARLSRFKDADKIEELVVDWSGDFDDFLLQYLASDSEEGYALFSDAQGHGSSKKKMILLIDAAGNLKKTLTSKGML